MQLDLLVINNKLIKPKLEDSDDEFGCSTDDDEDDDDDDDDDDESEDGDQINTVDLGDIGELLTGKDIKFEHHPQHHRNNLRTLKNLEKVIPKQQCQRAVIVVDRRQKSPDDSEEKEQPDVKLYDPMYMFQPKKPYAAFESVDNLCAPALHMNCLVEF